MKGGKMRVAILGLLLIGASLQAAERSPSPAAIVDDEAVAAFLVPVAVNAPGANATFFRTDLMIINYREVEQRVVLTWAPRGRSNVGSGAITRVVTLPANFAGTYRNIGETVFQTTGLGYITAISVDANGLPDTSGFIDGMSRIWTPQPGTTGTTSQALSPVRLGYINGNESAYIPGLRHDPGFRTNVGVVNLDSQVHVFNVRIGGTTGTTNFQMTVQPLSMDQQQIPAGDYGDLLITVAPADSFPTTGLGWHAYASSVDNVTGDAWVVNGAP
jgi:hypothetical protein